MSDVCNEMLMTDLVDNARKGIAREAIDDGNPSPLARFGLRMSPFADSVNPDLFFRTAAHDQAFTEMRRCIEEHVSLGLCTAPSGTGKTLLTQILLSSLDPRRHRAVLVLIHPGITPTGLLREIVGELGLPPPAKNKAALHDLVQQIQDEIIRLHQRDVKLVVIIDEVHFLRADCLHILRTLSNIELPERKLVTVLLFGEESFLKKMENPSYRSLFSRMFVRVGLRPLSRAEVEQYIKYRLLMAGGRPTLFDSGYHEVVTEQSRGIPREINRLCDAALRNAAMREATSVRAEDIPLQ